MLIATAFAALVMFAAPDAADAGTTPAQPPAAEAAKPKPKKVCRTEREPGSRLGRTVCVEQASKDEGKAPIEAPPKPEAFTR